MPPKIKTVSKRTHLAVPDERTFIKGIAHDIGKEVAHHIETMYPDAVKAASSTFLLSVKGCVYNEIMAAIDFRGNEAEMAKRLMFREAFRRHIRKAYKNIRKDKP